jgi:DNA processing protein
VVDGSAMPNHEKNQADLVIEVKPGQTGFPHSLSSIPQAPKILFYSGRLPSRPRVALVGSRKTDEYGRRMAYDIGAGLAAANVCVVSGGAGGVDTAALEGCLANGGIPVAVLGTGVDQVYPAANRELFKQIAARGALVSEYPCGTQGRPANFANRNRIVSGLSDGVVVIRAAKKSGSLITARQAVKQGRLLMAVPGQANESLSYGVHNLIREGAILVESTEDILKALSITDARQQSLELAPKPQDLKEEEQILFDQLQKGSSSIDTLSLQAGLSSATVAALLLQMEMRGLVVQKPGMVYSLSGLD